VFQTTRHIPKRRVNTLNYLRLRYTSELREVLDPIFRRVVMDFVAEALYDAQGSRLLIVIDEGDRKAGGSDGVIDAAPAAP